MKFYTELVKKQYLKQLQRRESVVNGEMSSTSGLKKLLIDLKFVAFVRWKFTGDILVFGLFCKFREESMRSC